ncbi:MAG: M17 family peptidase N-terminal domain-containing protein [Syntrophales bacterium]|nr:M17 family peptidase N-terminal domain-containing protein [Syntrophales bacterium]
MQIRISTKPLDIIKHEGLVLGFFSNERPPRGYCGLIDWRLNGMISTKIANGKITGIFMEKVLIAPHQRIPSSKVLLFGLGEATELTYDTLYMAGYDISHTITKINCVDFAFDIPAIGRCNLEVPLMTEAMITGCFDFLFKNIEKWGSVSPCILGDEACIDEIVLGLHKFKVSVKEKVKINILEGQ